MKDVGKKHYKFSIILSGRLVPTLPQRVAWLAVLTPWSIRAANCRSSCGRPVFPFIFPFFSPLQVSVPPPPAAPSAQRCQYLSPAAEPIKNIWASWRQRAWLDLTFYLFARCRRNNNCQATSAKRKGNAGEKDLFRRNIWPTKTKDKLNPWKQIVNLEMF